MGQRTQIFLVVEDEKKNTRVSVYHDQWGIGRRMPMAFFNLFSKFYSKGYGEDIKDVFSIADGEMDLLKCQTLNYEKGVLKEVLITLYNYEKKENVLEALPEEAVHEGDYPVSVGDWYRPETYSDFIEGHCDNNNGVMVVFVREYKEKPESWSLSYDIKVGFLLGFEDDGDCGKAFERWLTPEEFLSLPINQAYSNKKFRKLFQDYLNYFEVDTFNEVYATVNEEVKEEA